MATDRSGGGVEKATRQRRLEEILLRQGRNLGRRFVILCGVLGKERRGGLYITRRPKPKQLTRAAKRRAGREREGGRSLRRLRPALPPRTRAAHGGALVVRQRRR